MTNGWLDAITTALLLVLVALPAATLGGAAILLPFDRARWRASHVRRMLQRHGVVPAGLILMLVPEVIESQLDPLLTAQLPTWWREGPTAFFASLEGTFHADLQAALPWSWMEVLFTVVYVAGYPFLIIVCIMLPVWTDHGRLARRTLVAYAMSFAIALPFYLLFPVNEVWYHVDPANQGPVRNVINDFPLVRQHLYSFNDLNNCFPSLHTAISVALAALVWRSTMPRRLRVTVAGLAAGIVFATMYLGIHWVADVVAGLALAALVVWLARRWVPDRAPAGEGGQPGGPGPTARQGQGPSRPPG